MELNHLKYFYVVAREGGFSKASRLLHVAQPAITRVVKALEAELGVELLDRSGKTVTLTKTGSDIYRKCEVIFAEVDGIRHLTAKKPGELSGALSIGAVEPIANYLVPGALGALLARHPLLYPQVMTATARELVRLLTEGRIDLALLFHAPALPEGLELYRVFSLPFKLVAATGSQDDARVCSSFIGSREVDDDANKTYPTLERLRKVHPRAEIRVSSNSLTVHRELVLGRLGVAVLPLYMVAGDLEAGRMTALLDDAVLAFNLKVVTRRSDLLRPAAQTFLDELAVRLSGS